jgi:hypothetical protein
MLHKKHYCAIAASSAKGLFWLMNHVESPPMALLGLPGWLTRDRF